ncbi:rIIb-like protein [Stenotrophomonas phage C121]|uniref:RIIB lysis inhibitor n=1 Tax=Stenotrophomonas phage C121 TaxID=2914029 RepID=UPI00232916C8|nr:RIIB lysis inhibitor [Stenotrophomonas phage C121]UKL14791.1 rIIb-like protein [Stenotrophomonas phage C121]
MKIIVAKAVLQNESLTLITTTGKFHKIPQGDRRIRPLLDEIIPALNRNETIEVDLAEGTLGNEYAQFEEKTNGAVRFFRVLRSKLTGWFKKDSLTLENATYGSDQNVEEVSDAPTQAPATTFVAQPAAPFKEIQEEKSLKQIVAEAEPVSGLVFNTKGNVDLKPEETIIAVVDDNTILPDAQKLLPQISRANGLGSTKGVENFMRRTANMGRQHSQEDLIQFISKSDLQVADDGDILAYKNLSSSRTGEANVYVDPYTKKVRQWIGSKVFMNEKLVDPNRGQDCSNGLHVASRSYLRGYSGDGGTFLIRIRPEDVIAVPKYNTNKMRVCAYHIVGRLNDQDTAAMLADEPMVTAHGKALLAAAIDGTHVAITDTTEITGGYGEGCIYTNLSGKSQTMIATEVEAAVLDSDKTVEAINPDAPIAAPAVSVESVVQQIEENKKQSRMEIAQALYTDWVNFVAAGNTEAAEGALGELKQFKKNAKVSWDKLGVPSDENGPVAVADPQPEVDPTSVSIEEGLIEEGSLASNLLKAWEEYEGAVMGTQEEAASLDRFIKAVDAFNDDDEALIILEENTDAFIDDGDLLSYRATVNKNREKEEAMKAPVKTAKATRTSTTTTVKGKPAKAATKPASPREQLAKLLKNETSVSMKSKSVARSALSIKQAAKKSWEVLGVDPKLGKRIEELAK